MQVRITSDDGTPMCVYVVSADDKELSEQINRVVDLYRRGKEAEEPTERRSTPAAHPWPQLEGALAYLQGEADLLDSADLSEGARAWAMGVTYAIRELRERLLGEAARRG